MVGELNFELAVHPFAPSPEEFKGEISTKLHAFWFEAHEVRRFLQTIASIHHDHNSKKYEQQKLKTDLDSDAMTDNLWNAIQRNNNADGYGFLNTMPELDDRKGI